MIQITNQTQNYRNKKIMNWQFKEASTSQPNKLSKSYFKTFRQNQNLAPTLSTPKNIKILPKIQRLNKVQLGYRYVQTPISQLYNNRIKFNQTLSQQQKQSGFNLFFLSQKKRTVDGKKSDKIQSQLNFTSPVQNRLSYNNITSNNNNISSKYYVLNRKGKRPYNQDRYICKNNLHKFYLKNYKNQISKKQQKIQLYSVFDGHGGSACAQYLKQNFINFLLRSKTFQTNHQQALKQACRIAQQKFIALCQAKKFGLQTSGACALSCLVTENKVTVASIGDCRALMFNKQYLCEMTKDHKPSQITEKMRIIKCGGKIYKQQLRMNRPFNSTIKNFSCVRITPGNLNVSRTIGDIEAKMKKYGGLPGMISPQPQIKTFQKQNYQVLLLASDGLFQAFTNKQIQQFYYKVVECQKRKVIPASEIGQKFIESLMQEAEQKSTDNITIIVVMLNSSAYTTEKSLTLQNFTQKNINI